MQFYFPRSYRGPLRAILLDWAVRTMDYGCYAPLPREPNAASIPEPTA